jgi:hypothetical protein
MHDRSPTLRWSVLGQWNLELRIQNSEFRMSQELLPPGKPGLTEVCGFCTRRVVVDQLGTARDDQHRGEPRWNKENAAHAEVGQIERVEFFGIR